jgi:hypothetical protein
MTRKTKPSRPPVEYRFVSDEDSWSRFLRIYRRGVRKPIASICYYYSDDLAEQLSELMVKMPDLLPSCAQIAAGMIADLTFAEPENPYENRFDHRLLAGLREAIIETVRRSA